MADVVVLVVGLVFSSEDEIRNYYHEYANQVGFGVVKKSARKENGLPYFSLCYNRYEKFETTSSNLRPMKAANCLAKINVKVSREGQYTISKSLRFQSNQIISMQVKRTLETNDAAGIQMNKNYSSMVHEASEYEHITFGESEARAYIRKMRLELGVDEALQQYFNRMQEKSNDFYYVMYINDEGRL